MNCADRVGLVPTRPPSFVRRLNAVRRAVGGAPAVPTRSQSALQAECDRIRSSHRWRRVRAQVLREDPLCTSCRGAGRTELATQVDHIVPLHVNVALAFERSNLQGLCTSCHARKGVVERGLTPRLGRSR